MTAFSPDWLALRESADAAARSTELLAPLRRDERRRVIRDLGCGTGSMGRWLAGRLNGPQHWILHDRDPLLLARAVEGMNGLTAADGSPVTTEVHEGDLTDLRGADLAGADLITASALLDLLTFEQVEGLAEACVQAGCPSLLTLSVVGRVELTPSDPFDTDFAAAFNDHQRRGLLLGPDAPDTAAQAFERRGAVVRTRPSPWRLGPDQAELVREWLRGWVDAAVERRPDLDGDAYFQRRLDSLESAVVHHSDLLALPEAALFENARSETVRSETVRSETVRSETVRSENVRSENVRSEGGR
ncbi:class I SAM-dependent methyltransferase [Actinomadura barringtoniae]|uniref:class I SAM-dependent methyltransferase n=1 Tax=Actinomadura barringtoniae TaxID=1427535 RepID=UPI0027DE3723|nr:class I SAM-dependent methyltransferase [Actinomadura barringtoniae]